MAGNIFDDEGFLVSPDLWTEDISRNMAMSQFDIILSDMQLRIIASVRDYYKKWETLPILKRIRDDFGLEASEIDEMFRRGESTARGVICKLAGLPKMLCISSGC